MNEKRRDPGRGSEKEQVDCPEIASPSRVRVTFRSLATVHWHAIGTQSASSARRAQFGNLVPPLCLPSSPTWQLYPLKQSSSPFRPPRSFRSCLSCAFPYGALVSPISSSGIPSMHCHVLSPTPPIRPREIPARRAGCQRHHRRRSGHSTSSARKLFSSCSLLEFAVFRPSSMLHLVF